MKDLTKGNPFKLILLFALPVLMGNIVQQLFSMVDTVIVGNTVNADALTGVGMTGSIIFCILGFANGLSAGFSVRVSQRFGAGDEEGLKRAVAMSFTLCAIISVVMTAIAVPLTGPLLRLLDTPDRYFDYAYAYLMTIFCGIAASVFYNVLSGILRALGDSKSPLVFLMLAAVLNIGLDLVFILVFQMHYTGAALATVFSNLLSAICCFIYMWKKYPVLRLKKKDFAWDWHVAGGHMAVGLPMALQFSVTAVGCMIQQSALNGLNAQYPGVVTAYTAASKIDNLGMQIFIAIGTAIANFTGQNYGAKNHERIQKGVNVALIYTLVGYLVSLVICLVASQPLMSLFINEENTGDYATILDQLFAYGKQYLLCQFSMYFFLGLIHIYRNALQGMGKSAVTTFAGVLELLGRAVTAFVLVEIWGFDGFCFSNALAWIAADVFLLAVYYVTMRKRLHQETPTHHNLHGGRKLAIYHA